MKKAMRLSVAGLVVLAGVGFSIYWFAGQRPVEGASRPAQGTNGVSAGGVTVATANHVVHGFAGLGIPSDAHSVLADTNHLAGATNLTAKAAERTADQIAADKMRDLLDSGDERGAIVLARKLMESPDEDVRQAVVLVLGWVGLTGFSDLTQMLDDSSESVAADALRQWRQTIQEVVNEQSRAALLVQAMIMVKDEDEKEGLINYFSQMREDIAVTALARLIQSGDPVAAEIAREHYAFITQTPWTDVAAADRWIQENVEAPDSTEEMESADSDRDNPVSSTE